MASAQDLFGQLWKEYALSDSRYMTSDTVVLCMETMTVVSVEAADRETTRQAQLILIMHCIAPVGTTLLRGCIYDRDAPSPAPPDPDHRVYEPSLRRHAVLCDQSVRSLCKWKVVLSTGAVLFRGVLLFDEFHLDRGALLYELTVHTRVST